jgi:hypothetical protein
MTGKHSQASSTITAAVLPKLLSRCGLSHHCGSLFTGGEFVLTEQRPRMQSGVEVVPFCQGDAVAFAVYNRPVHGSRGNYRVNLRHGVSRVRFRHAAHRRNYLPRRDLTADASIAARHRFSHVTRRAALQRNQAPLLLRHCLTGSSRARSTSGLRY